MEDLFSNPSNPIHRYNKYRKMPVTCWWLTLETKPGKSRTVRQKLLMPGEIFRLMWRRGRTNLATQAISTGACLIVTGMLVGVFIMWFKPFAMQFFGRFTCRNTDHFKRGIGVGTTSRLTSAFGRARECMNLHSVPRPLRVLTHKIVVFIPEIARS